MKQPYVSMTGRFFSANTPLIYTCFTLDYLHFEQSLANF